MKMMKMKFNYWTSFFLDFTSILASYLPILVVAMITPKVLKLAFRKINILLLSFLLFPSVTKAAFVEPYWSARVASLGGAYTALADDAAAVFYNPAATPWLKARYASFTYSKLFAGLDGVNMYLNHFSYVQPLLNRSSLGIGWGNFNASNLYREDTLLISLGYDLKDWLGTYAGKLGIGVTAKYLMRGYSMDERSSADPVFKDGSRQHAATFDMHFYSSPFPFKLPGLSLGMTFKSINRPNIGFQENQGLPFEVVGGLVYKWRSFAFPVDVWNRSGELGYRVGTEFNYGPMSLRLGGDPNQIATGVGYTHEVSERLSVVFDYAFMMPLELQETSGSHRATLGLKF